MELLTEKQQQDSDFVNPPVPLWKKPLVWITGWFKKEKPKDGSILTFKQKIQTLTISQWFYLLAVLVLVASYEEGQEFDDVSFFAVVLAGIGLSRELWHLFHAIWSKTLGKGVLLVLYAGTANIAIAVSALKINIVAGVEPTPFIFTLGFTTLLLLPFWLVTATVFFFLVALVVANLWLLGSALLRLIGIKVPVHWEDRNFVGITMVLRIVLILILVAGLVNFMKPYAEQLDVFEQPVAVFNNTLTIPHLLVEPGLSHQS